MRRRIILPWGSSNGRALAFTIALAVGGLIALSRLALQDVLGGASPFLLAWPAMMLAAFIAGFWPSALVAVLGAVVGYLVLSEARLPTPGPIAWAVYAAFALVIAATGEGRLRAQRREREHLQRLAEMQARLMNVGRLNALGEMAGSLAHELNQPLTAVTNYVNAIQQLLARGGEYPPRVDDLLVKVADQASRAGQIVARARANVDRGAIVASEQSLSSMFTEAVDVAAVGVSQGDVSLRWEFDPAADRVFADRIQAQQVILNLVRNAIEAMDGEVRRELRIGSRADGSVTEAYVADTGPGIAPEVAQRLFEPFVTGKANGMGVGLSISRNIIEAHGGRIWATTAAGGGAEFRFTLPRAPQEG